MRRWWRGEFRSSSLATPDPWLEESFTGPSFAGERVTPRKAMGLAGVFAAVYKISETVGQMPLKVYRVQDDDERIEARTHRSWSLLHDKPNEYTVAHAFWATAVAQLCLNGNAYLYKQRDDAGVVESLWLVDPWTITIKQSNGQRVYEQNVGMNRNLFGPDDLTHIMGFSLDGIRGVSRIEYCRQTLGIAMARDRYEGGFYERGARVPGVIEYPGRLGPDGTKNLADSFQARHGGTKQQHKVPVLEEGATFKKVGMSLEDMQFVENAQLSLTEIAVLFDLPPGELGGMHGGSLEYSTEELNQIRLARAVVPYSSRIAKTVSADPSILPLNVMFAEFTIEALMRPDMKTQAEWWKTLLDENVVDQKFVASRLNLPEPPKPKPAPVNPLQNGGGNGTAALPSEMIANMQKVKGG